MRAQICSDGTAHTVTVDGRDLSAAVATATVYLSGNAPAEATLEVSLPIIDVVAQATVHVSDEARELLVAAGWTPPRG